MTEAEAHRKVCPFHNYAPVVSNNCLASQCMMWRWLKWDGIPAHHPGKEKLGDCALAAGTGEER